MGSIPTTSTMRSLIFIIDHIIAQNLSKVKSMDSNLIFLAIVILIGVTVFIQIMEFLLGGV